MYDEQGFQVSNPIDRFAIGDRDKLTFNADGSLDLYIQSDSPGKDKESNWLPAPKAAPFAATMRIYAPTSGIDERDSDSAAHQAPQVTGRFTERRKRPTPLAEARAEACRARRESRRRDRSPRVSTRGSRQGGRCAGSPPG